MYKLICCPGISRLDEPCFENITQQTLYFNSLESTTIDAVYPPYYTNKISFSTEDINITEKYNYLSLQFNGKYYYYFIDDISYINEDIFELQITMDTIQTFMFDFSIINATVTRNSINRWNSDETINRKYIRENLSKGVFVDDGYLEYGTNYNIGFAIAYSTKAFSNTDVPTCDIIDNFKSVPTGLYAYIIPIFDSTTIAAATANGGKLKYGWYRLDPDLPSPSNSTYVGAEFDWSAFNINKLIDNPYITNIIYINATCISRVFDYKFTNKTNTINGVSELYIRTKRTSLKGNEEKKYPQVNRTYLATIDNVQYPYLSVKSLPNYFVNIDSFYPKAVIKNTSLGVKFDSKFVPQLIDENYISVKYGERGTMCEFPLHKTTKSSIDFYQGVDLFTGTRCYFMSNNTSGKDRLFTLVSTPNSQTFNLINDAWNNYYANNKATLGALGTSSAIANILYKGAYSNYNNSVILSAKYKSQDIASPMAKMGLLNTGLNVINYGVDRLITRENLENAPGSVIQTGTITTDTLNKSATLVYSRMYVSDIEECAEELEHYGYKQNMDISNVDNVFTELNNRYYYNIIKLEDISIKEKILIGNVLKSDLIARFENGLRMWNYNNGELLTDGIGYRLAFDNVEKDYL